MSEGFQEKNVLFYTEKVDESAFLFWRKPGAKMYRPPIGALRVQGYLFYIVHYFEGHTHPFCVGRYSSVAYNIPKSSCLAVVPSARS
jgi:hypothetical protein